VNNTRPKLNLIKNTEMYKGEEKTRAPVSDSCLVYEFDRIHRPSVREPDSFLHVP